MSQQVLLLTDIFGQCAGLERLLADLHHTGAEVHSVDPYQGKRQQFADETQAYSAYIEACGHDSYAAIAAQALQSHSQPFDLAIGFSAGATALWRALTATYNSKLKQAILFYPGQIHQHLALTPQVPTQVIFGHSEPHFAVADICRQLQQQGVTAISTPYAHGFINPASQAFAEAGYQQYLAQFHAAITTGATAVCAIR
ncbi:dienelactone hydrolase family protein [Rheinheimera sp.]|uniref:dienelactone hydrolase family protein n=1 Tax=Rheinheimera sp. TaxID=1869214 RepID=UPI0040470B5F